MSEGSKPPVFGAPLWVHVLYIVLAASGVAGMKLWDWISSDLIPSSILLNAMM